jgi:hypothetical protein
MMIMSALLTVAMVKVSAPCQGAAAQQRAGERRRESQLLPHMFGLPEP